MQTLLDRHFRDLENIVDQSADEALESLRCLLRFPTVSGSNTTEGREQFARALAESFDWLEARAGRMGFETRRHDGRVLVIEQAGSGDEIVGLPLHMDVVPPGDGWCCGPFAGDIRDGVLYGRGTQDDKGPIAQMLFALDAVRRLGLPFRRTVRLIVASQEETGCWDDVESYLETERPPTMCIVSDSVFPIVNGEKGMVDFAAAIDWPADGAGPGPKGPGLRELAGGERSNVVPDLARLVFVAGDEGAEALAAALAERLERFCVGRPGAKGAIEAADAANGSVSLAFHGKRSHSSLPAEGRNALHDALRFIASLDARQPAGACAPDAVRTAAGFLADVCEPLDGSGFGLQASHAFIGDTTASLGVLRLGPEGIRAVVNVRPTFGQAPATVIERAAGAVGAWAAGNGFGARVEGAGKSFDALFVDPEKNPELIGALQTAFERVTGEQSELRAMGGSTFAKAFPSAVSFGPVWIDREPNLTHQVDECVAVDAVRRNTLIYAAALLQLAAGADER